MKNIITTLVLSLSWPSMYAQSPILTKVNIEFEKKVNNSATQGRFGRDFGGSAPQYTSSFYLFQSDGEKSLYKAIPNEDNDRSGFFRGRGTDENVTFTNYNAKEQIALKKVFEKSYLVADSFRKIDWKITNDFREIAGFNCRRATAIIMDSVFVVAFYTNEILPSGGPEGFTGLPGMILGLVINRLHTTWYATKVNVTDVNPKEIVSPVDSKAEKITRDKLAETLKERFKNSGWFGSSDAMIWNIMI